MTCCENPPKSRPGTCRIFVSRANLERNRLPGSPGTLPSVIVEHQAQRYHSTLVQVPHMIFRWDGEARPTIWGEATWPTTRIVRAFPVEEPPLRQRLMIQRSEDGVGVFREDTGDPVHIFDQRIEGTVFFVQARDPTSRPGVWIDVAQDALERAEARYHAAKA